MGIWITIKYSLYFVLRNENLPLALNLSNPALSLSRGRESLVMRRLGTSGTRKRRLSAGTNDILEIGEWL
ncbi:MAG: hypothetical protein BWY66_00993 [bacterium ADurb.Bin374]|nr:MAG: hypothetical protein BWY66_00993 [bacterium ADurb.Bin374]